MYVKSLKLFVALIYSNILFAQCITNLDLDFLIYSLPEIQQEIGSKYFEEDSILITEVFNRSNKIASLEDFRLFVTGLHRFSLLDSTTLSNNMNSVHYEVYGGIVTLSYHFLMFGDEIYEMHCEIEARKEEARRIKHLISLPLSHTLSKLIYYHRLPNIESTIYRNENLFIPNTCMLDADLRQSMIIELHDYRKYYINYHLKRIAVHFPYDKLTDYMKAVRYVVANRDIGIVRTMLVSVVPHTQIFGAFIAEHLISKECLNLTETDFSKIKRIKEMYSKVISSGTINRHTGPFELDRYDLELDFIRLLSMM